MFVVIAAILIAQARSGTATDSYTTCIFGNARAFASDRDIARPVDAALAQCEPFLSAAAAELGTMAGEAGRAKFRADYRSVHGTDPDLDALLADMVRGAGRDLAERIITGRSYDTAPKRSRTK